jgi:cell division ATPase FtsA
VALNVLSRLADAPRFSLLIMMLESKTQKVHTETNENANSNDDDNNDNDDNERNNNTNDNNINTTNNTRWWRRCLRRSRDATVSTPLQSWHYTARSIHNTRGISRAARVLQWL